MALPDKIVGVAGINNQTSNKGFKPKKDAHPGQIQGSLRKKRNKKGH